MTTHLHSTSTFHVRLSIGWVSEDDEDGHEPFWDALNTWCSQHGGYLGGTPASACIVVSTGKSRFVKQLERWLALHSVIAKFHVRPSSLDQGPRKATGGEQSHHGETPTPQELSALLEAVGNYQQHLVESFQRSLDILPRLSETLRRWHADSEPTAWLP